MSKPKIIICDIDGTLANCDHRRHFVEGPVKDWKSFLAPENVLQDTVNEWCRRILRDVCTDQNQHDGRVYVVLVTGRPEILRIETSEWLKQIETLDFYFEFLLMRPDGDYGPDEVVKAELYDKHIKDKYDVLFVLDDRKKVVDMWRSKDLVCLQCAPGDL